MKVKIAHLSSSAESLPLPTYATVGSAGMDLYASCLDPIFIKAGDVEIIPTGIAISLEDGYEAQVRSRSGMAANFGVFALNSPGTIDSDYRGEIKVILANFGKGMFRVKHGDKIAQLVVARYEKVDWEVVENLDETIRGSGGFGSTDFREFPPDGDFLIG